MEHDLKDYKVVAVPMAYMFREGYAEQLQAFAEAGGTLVLTYWSGIVDDTDRCYLGGTPHGLIEAAGVRSTEIDALYDGEENYVVPVAENHLSMDSEYSCKYLCDLVKVTDSEVLMEYRDDFYAGMPALTHRACGEGHIYYVCADMEEAFYQEFYPKVISEAGLKPVLSEIPKGVSVNVREKGDIEYLFVQNFARETVKIRMPDGYTILFGEIADEMKPLESRVWKRKK